MVENDPAKEAQAANCLEGVAYGDAAGAPSEMMTAEEILEATGGRGITAPGDEIDATKRKVPDTRGLKPGTTTDDWGLTRRVGEMYARLGRFDPETLALLHLLEFRASRSGFGGTTVIALWEIEKYFLSCKKASLIATPPPDLSGRDLERWELAAPRHPALPARVHGKNGSGNGPPMKIAPVGLFHGLRGWDPADHEPVLSEVMQISFMTHGDPIPGIAAYAMASAIAELIRRGPAKDAARLERVFVTALEVARVAESRFVYLMRSDERFSDVLAEAWIMSRDAAGPKLIAELAGRRTSLAISTVPAAFGFWFLHPHDPKAAVLAAANAGGDADTIASMAGALSGANSSDPKAWKGWEPKVPAALEARRLAHQLCAAATYPMGLHGIDLDEIKQQLGYL